MAVILATLPDLHTYAPPVGCSPYADQTPSSELIGPLDRLNYVFFIIEIVVGLIVAPSLLNYFRSPTNVIDFISVSSWFVLLIIRAIDVRCRVSRHNLMKVIQVFRLLRIFRIFYLMNQFRPLQILFRVLSVTRYELKSIGIFFGLSVLFYGMIIYFAERQVPDSLMTTIPMTLYWAIVTVVPVCYGDTYPIAAGGCASASPAS